MCLEFDLSGRDSSGTHTSRSDGCEPHRVLRRLRCAPGFAAGLFDSRRCWHRSGVGVLLEGGFIAAGPGGCSVEDAGLFDVPAAVAVGVSSSVSEWFPSPGITPMTHLQVDPPSYLNTPPPEGTLPRGVSTRLAAPLKRLRGDRSCRLGRAPRENSPEVHHSGPTRPATPETPVSAAMRSCPVAAM